MRTEHWHADQSMKSHVLKALLHIINLIIEDYKPSIACLLFFKQNQLSLFPKAKMHFEMTDGLKTIFVDCKPRDAQR